MADRAPRWTLAAQAVAYIPVVLLCAGLDRMLLISAAAVSATALAMSWQLSRGRSWSIPLGWALAVLFAVMAFRAADPPDTDDALISLYALDPPEEPTPDEMEAALGLVEEVILARSGGKPAPSCAEPGGHGGFLADAPAGAVFVTLWLDHRPFSRGRAAEGPLVPRLCSAADQALDGWTDWESEAESVRVQVDLTQPPRRLRPRPSHRLALRVLTWVGHAPAEALDASGRLCQLGYEVEPGVTGLMLVADGREGILLPADPVTRGWLTPSVRTRPGKVHNLLIHLSRDAGGPSGLWEEDGTELYRFTAVTFGRPVPGGPAVPFFRGNAGTPAVDDEALLDGIASAARWLRGRLRADGSFDYEYFPNTDSNSDEYNVIRHAGCVHGLLDIHALARREPALAAHADGYLDAALTAMDWVYANMAPPEFARDPDLVALIDDERRASSGAAAFALLAMLHRPDASTVSDPELCERLSRPQDDVVMEGLGRFLLAMIDDRGRVFRHYDETLTHDEVLDEPLYLPGETMLALAVFHRRTGDPRWLEGARRIGDWQIEKYRAERPNPGHWEMQALTELYEITGEERHARACLEMADHFVSEQIPPHPALFPDYLGAFRRPDDLPRTTRAAARSEALGAAVRAAWALGEDATVYEDALLAAARHLLENQWRPDNSYYLPDPGRAEGALRMGLVDNHCRIDNNKHAMRGLAAALAVVRHREAAAAPVGH